MNSNKQYKHDMAMMLVFHDALYRNQWVGAYRQLDRWGTGN
jgi:hypothetical protein